MAVVDGDFSPPAGRFAIVAARFNSIVVDALLAGALDAFRRHGVAEDAVDIVRVPGSFEIPLVAQQLANGKRHVAIVCLGAVIQGETDHYDHVCAAVVNGLTRAVLDSCIPIIFGVLTCETLEQALNRAGGKAGNKGFESAVAAIEMANLQRKLKLD